MHIARELGAIGTLARAEGGRVMRIATRAPEDRWLRTVHAAHYAGYASPEGYVAWAASVGLPSIRRGRCLLWDRLDIDRHLEAAKRYPGAISAREARVGVSPARDRRLTEGDV